MSDRSADKRQQDCHRVSFASFLSIVVLTFLLESSAYAKDFSKSVVWKPSAARLAEIHKACSEQTPELSGRCIEMRMKTAGASASAIRFYQETHGAIATAFRHTGLVDIVRATSPFRANENDQIFFVNGKPAVVDIDDSRLLSERALANNPDFKELVQRYPEVTLWPGDRTDFDQLKVSKLPGGAIRFIAPYKLRNRCHACAVLGSAEIEWDFNREGRWFGVRPVSVRSGAPASAQSR